MGRHLPTRGLALVAAALADLDLKAALPVLKARQRELESPVTKEVFKEAIDRLQTQTAAPEIKNRMIWLFGMRTASEIARGSETDNAFIQRAIARTQDAALGEVYETDASTGDS